MLKIIATAAVLVLLPTCSHTLGYAGKNPGAVECKGKASMSFTGSGYLGAGVGGTEINGGSITFDCGPDGAYLKQGLPAIADPISVPAKP